MSKRESAVIVGASGAVDDGPVVSWAIEEAGRRGARLVIAHACSWSSDLDDDLPLPRHPGLVDAIGRARAALGSDRVTVRLARPPAGAMLVGLATSGDLLVVGSPTQSGWSFWNSSTDFVARHAGCPVVVVRPPVDPGSDAPFAGHVVVGVDGSPAAQAALAFGFDEASRRGVPLAAVHVTPGGVQDVWYDDQRLEAHLTTEPAALELLARAVGPMEHAYPEVWVKRAVFAGQPLRGLLRAAEGAALLVLGAHASGAARRMRLGSTSLAAMGRAASPVVILPSPAIVVDHPTKEVEHVPA
jgi:nucleotide-binding universal stress UspA family protein